MRTFDASLSPRVLGGAVIVPPLIFFGLVGVWANGMERGELGPRGILFLVALAQLIPLIALLWILFSPAAYSISAGKLVVHRVMFDREFSFENLTEPPRLTNSVITLQMPRRIHLRVRDPQDCLQVLEHASVKSGSRPGC